MSTISPITPSPASGSTTSKAWTPPTPGTIVHERGNFLGHPVGLFLLFMVEMWERFSYYGMRALLVLYLTSPTSGMRKLPPGAAAGFNPGPGWSDESANTLYGWYTGLAYLLPLIGGMIADKLIGTHRSMLVGSVLIMTGHIALASTGMPFLAHTGLGMSVFIFGLAIIVIGTGHFKPSVSVMVGQLYPAGDPRRDGAFSIFYMGINLGAFLCAYVCGTLGEKVGWHWGFGSAAVGMFLGLAMYSMGRPKFLQGIGEPPAGVANFSGLFLIGGAAVAAGFAALFHFGVLSGFSRLMTPPVTIGLGIAVLIASTWFIAVQRPGDRGPVTSIFIFMLFNAFFWFAFEQAGSSINLFTDRYTDASVTLPRWFVTIWDASGAVLDAGLGVVGIAVSVVSLRGVFRNNRLGKYPTAVGFLVLFMLGIAILSAAILKPFGYWPSAAEFKEIPTTWFQSVNPLLIFIFAPVFAVIWTGLGRRKMNPSQPLKISFGLILLGLGFVALVVGARTIRVAGPSEGGAAIAKASMLFVLGTYFLHTMGELCLSPTGLAYVTKAAPVRFVSLLMGIWFISSFIANLGGGLIAAQTEKIEKGEIKLPWNLGAGTGSLQADFFTLFVVTSIGAGVVVLVLTPWLRKLMRHPND